MTSTVAAPVEPDVRNEAEVEGESSNALIWEEIFATCPTTSARTMGIVFRDPASGTGRDPVPETAPAPGTGRASAPERDPAPGRGEGAGRADEKAASTAVARTNRELKEGIVRGCKDCVCEGAEVTERKTKTTQKTVSMGDGSETDALLYGARLYPCRR